MNETTSPLPRDGRESAVEAVRTILRAKAIALVGASDDPLKHSGNPIRILDRYPFPGGIYPVSRSRDSLGGIKAWRSIGEIPGAVDVALLLVPRDAVYAAVEECAAKGIAAVVIVTAGFAESGEEGGELQRRLLDLVRSTGIRIIGPNCIGFYSGAADLALNASAAFVTGRVRKGSIGLITQSGAIGTALLPLAAEQGLGASLWFSVGNEMDLTVADFLVAAVSDVGTKLLILYLEAIRDVALMTSGLIDALRARKPVIVLKVGASEQGAERAQAHTGALVGADAVNDGYFRQFGVLRAKSASHLLPMAMAFNSSRKWGRGRIAVLSISGAVAVHLSDRFSDEAIDLVQFQPETVTRLEAVTGFAGAGNPYDPSGLAIGNPKIISESLDIILADPGVDILVVVISFAIHLLRIIPPVVEELAKKTDKLICMVRWMPHDFGLEPFAPFAALDVPVFHSVEDCTIALAARSRYERDYDTIVGALAERHVPTEPVPAPELDSASGALLETEARAILQRYGIHSPAEAIAHSAEEALVAARQIGYPVALKVLSRQLLHKTEAGGVSLDIDDDAALRAAYQSTLASVRQHNPAMQIEGVLIQAMAKRGIEVIIGAKHEPPFGAVVMVGAGGELAEAISKIAVRPVPLTRWDTEAMIDESGLGSVLNSRRRGRPGDRAALVKAVMSVSRLMVDHGAAIAELDINPLRVMLEGEGIVALDALIIPRAKS